MGDEPWVLVDSVSLENDVVVAVDGRESQHLAGPLRLRPGDGVILADGCGRTAAAVLQEVSGRRCEAEIREVRTHPSSPDPGVTIALFVLHGQAMDWAVQKAVEIGVATFVPVVGERSQIRLKTASARLGHWRRIARQAIKQCRRPWQMEVVDPCPLADLIGRYRDRCGAVADSAGLRLPELAGAPPDLLVVGPEGGFGHTDLEALARIGWPRIRLGDHVLRAETAAIVGAAFLISARR